MSETTAAPLTPAEWKVATTIVVTDDGAIDVSSGQTARWQELPRWCRALYRGPDPERDGHMYG